MVFRVMKMVRVSNSAAVTHGRPREPESLPRLVKKNDSLWNGARRMPEQGRLWAPHVLFFLTILPEPLDISGPPTRAGWAGFHAAGICWLQFPTDSKAVLSASNSSRQSSHSSRCRMTSSRIVPVVSACESISSARCPRHSSQDISCSRVCKIMLKSRDAVTGFFIRWKSRIVDGRYLRYLAG